MSYYDEFVNLLGLSYVNHIYKYQDTHRCVYYEISLNFTKYIQNRDLSRILN
jgi:hypothetical protein